MENDIAKGHVIMTMGMSQELEELPLFPLSTVLFPYATVQLHVFEDRYRQLVRDCMEFDTSFGIVLIRSGSEVGGTAEPYMVGTTVRISRVHTYDDGRMDIQVQGEARFRIRKIDESKPYLVGYVEPVVELELEDSPRADALIMKAREDFELWIQKLISRNDFNVQVRFPEDKVALSFAIANLLPIENLEKQRLLETTDTLERIQGLIPILEEQIIETRQPSYFRLRPEDLGEWITPN
jgi:Lon protease-like protein